MLRKTMLLSVASLGLTILGATHARAQYPYPPPAYPQYPVGQTPTRIDSIDPYTGAVNTSGTTIYNSAFDPSREWARNLPGNQRQVNRPAANGGWEVGVEWYNPATGQWHGETRIISANGLNAGGGLNSGLNSQTVFRMAPSSGFPATPVSPGMGGFNSQLHIRSGSVGGLHQQGQVYGGGRSPGGVRPAPMGGMRQPSNAFGGGRPQGGFGGSMSRPGTFGPRR